MRIPGWLGLAALLAGCGSGSGGNGGGTAAGEANGTRGGVSASAGHSNQGGTRSGGTGQSGNLGGSSNAEAGTNFGGTGAGGTNAGGTNAGGQADGSGRALDPVTGCRYELIKSDQGSSDVFVRDFDLDGELDVEVTVGAPIYGGKWGIAWGSASSFAALAFTSFAPNSARTILADLNGDGAEDFLFSGSVDNPTGAADQIYFGDGKGGFAPQPLLRVNAGFGTVAADFDLDGKVDLMWVGSSNQLLVYPGNGDGTFGAPYTGYTYSASYTNAEGLALGDLNEDGKMDAVLSMLSLSGRAVAVLTNNGDRTFTLAGTKMIQAGFAGLFDLNRDGHLDMAVPDQTNDQLRVWLGDGTGALAVVTGLIPKVGQNPLHTASGDVNGDGRPDLVVTNSDSRDLSVLLGNGDGTFNPESRIDLSFASPGCLTVQDLDQDGYADIIVCTVGGVRIYYGPCPPS